MQVRANPRARSRVGPNLRVGWLMLLVTLAPRFIATKFALRLGVTRAYRPCATGVPFEGETPFSGGPSVFAPLFVDSSLNLTSNFIRSFSFDSNKTQQKQQLNLHPLTPAPKKFRP